MRPLATLLLLTLISACAGALAGFHLFTMAERTADAKKIAEAPVPVASTFTASARLRKLAPIVTNLASPGVWARVEASMVTDSLTDEEAGILAAHISEDMIAYLRSSSVAQFEGTRGLQALREDLTERAAVRSAGKVRELIIETLVIQ